VIEAQGGERSAVVADFARLPTENRTNAGERKAFEVGGNACAGASREEQFVFFAAVKGLFEGGGGETRGVENFSGGSGG